ncbi:SH3 domain-binding protein 2 isoform 2-T2 [Pholidichthys leucotaenia]
MDLLPALVSPVLASSVSMLRDNPAIQTIYKKFNRRTMMSSEVCWPVPMRAIGAQNLLTMPGGVSTAGYLHKKGGSQFSLRKWPLRYIILHKGCVYYFKTSTSAAPQGAFSLNGYNRVMRAAEETTSSNVFPFKIVHFSKKHRTWFFSAASEDERRKWMRYLRREIDHYNDRKESNIASDSDSDADSFYGTIERPMDIKHPVNTADDNYDHDDEEDDDYLQPDGESSGRPAGMPPSCPPPPVPGPGFPKESGLGFIKRPPPPIPQLDRNTTCPLPRKPPPSMPPPILQKDNSKGCLPPLPLGPYPSNRTPPMPPAPPPKNMKPPPIRTTSVGVGGNDNQRFLPAVTIQSPVVLPICNQLDQNGIEWPLPCPYPHNKPTLPPPPSVHAGGSLSNTFPSHPPPHSPKLGYPNKPSIPKPPVSTDKPRLPATRSMQPETPFQRASPDGQSFRSLGKQTPTDFRRLQNSPKFTTEDDSSDYEDVQLPESVFIDSNETSFVERLFKEGPNAPEDGLYAIRNSGTRTAQVLVVWDVNIGKARNYRLFQEEDCVFLEAEVTFPSLSILIEHYYSHPLPNHESLYLQKPYVKI